MNSKTIEKLNTEQVRMLSNHRLLIVHKDRNMRNLLRIYLLEKGFSIKVAATGHYSLTMLKKHSFDIILLEVKMPDMDGCQVCKIIRGRDTVPIIMLSASTKIEEKLRCFGMGVS
ncbi:MAG: response regulator [Paenibacillus sp.]|nr:response regulator [Paenibacillus sp.]